MSKRASGRCRVMCGLLGVIAIGILVVAMASGTVAAHTGDDGYHHHDGWMGSHGGTGGWMVGGLGVLWMVVWTVVLIGVPAVLGYLWLTRRSPRDERTGDDALAVLRRRYAQGEIDDDEFETRRAKLLGENH